MDTKQIAELLARYERNECTEEERLLVDQWFSAHGAGEGEFDRMNETEQKAWVEALYRDVASINEAADRSDAVRVLKLWPRIAVVAAAIAAIVFGIWLFNGDDHPGVDEARKDLLNAANDIAPGRNGATITLASGRVIQLSDAKKGVIVGETLKYDDGVEVFKEGQDNLKNNNTMLIARTARGQTYQFTLPDGTKVWLNADSKISFPNQFFGNERKILLSGEGYFEVVRNTKAPFIVLTDKQEVAVLGTHFNIKAYAEELQTKTTLLEGSVKVSSLASFSMLGQEGRNPEVSTMLKPGEQAALSDQKKLLVEAVNTEEVVAWKNGLFTYNGTELEEALRQASRWYDVQFIYEDKELRKRLLSGSVTRYDKLSGFLNAVSYTAGVRFKIADRKVYVAK